MFRIAEKRLTIADVCTRLAGGDVVQWVMAHPLSHGSLQAKAMIAQASSAL